eukprot:6184619-Pleurochrysis_carterae.AAC.5
MAHTGFALVVCAASVRCSRDEEASREGNCESGRWESTSRVCVSVCRPCSNTRALTPRSAILLCERSSDVKNSGGVGPHKAQGAPNALSAGDAFMRLQRQLQISQWLRVRVARQPACHWRGCGRSSRRADCTAARGWRASRSPDGQTQA